MKKNSPMKPLREVLASATARIPAREARVLLGAVCGFHPSDCFLHEELLVDVDAVERFVARRREGEPLDYILGSISFSDVRIDVTPEVLIPRPETEILVEHIAKHLATLDLSGRSLVDVCTGSGCIAIALKKRFPKLCVYAVDVCENALRIAAENARRNNVEVHCLQGDLLAPLDAKRFDFCVANPPYISDAEYGALDHSVRSYEPEKALRGGVDGLALYRRLAEELPRVLIDGARVFLEIGCRQAESLRDIFHNTFWRRIECLQDWAGHDRFIFLEYDRKEV